VVILLALTSYQWFQPSDCQMEDLINLQRWLKFSIATLIINLMLLGLIMTSGVSKHLLTIGALLVITSFSFLAYYSFKCKKPQWINISSLILAGIYIILAISSSFKSRITFVNIIQEDEFVEPEVNKMNETPSAPNFNLLDVDFLQRANIFSSSTQPINFQEEAQNRQVY
jgi:hypothetical protein